MSGKGQDVFCQRRTNGRISFSYLASHGIFVSCQTGGHLALALWMRQLPGHIQKLDEKV